MDRFRITLCLNGVRTSDNAPLHVEDAQTLSVDGACINADDIVERALPSRVATAIESSMAAAPAYSSSVFFLLGSQVHHGRLGDAVVNYVVRDQARHRSLLYDRQVSQRPVVTLPATALAQRSGTPLQYEECLLFAYDNGAVACETLRSSDAAETVDEVLGALRVISLAVFKYASHKTCLLLVGSHLSTAHMAMLLLASRRHVFLYVDATMSAREVEATTVEMQQVRHALTSFALPLDRDLQEARAALTAEPHASPLPMSRTLDAVAHSSEEYELLMTALALESSARDTARASRTVEADQAARSKLQRELHEARAAQQAAEAELAEQRQAHREEVILLREELQHFEGEKEAKHSASVESESLNGGRPVSQNLLHSFQQQSQSHLEASVTQLQQALQDAVKAQKYAEEKARLLELRHTIDEARAGASASPAVEFAANGSVVSPRPSLRLPSAPVPTLTSDGTHALSWEQSLLQQENTALVAEFQRKEKEWQQRLRHASAEVAQLRQAKAAMETTLQLQSQTIAAAQQALLNSRAAHEQEMKQVLSRVRTLSRESQSRHHGRASSSMETSGARTSRGGDDEAVAEAAVPVPKLQNGGTRTPPPSARITPTTKYSDLMSPKR